MELIGCFSLLENKIAKAVIISDGESTEIFTVLLAYFHSSQHYIHPGLK